MMALQDLSRRFVSGALIGGLLLLAGCAGGPQQPLMEPLATAKSFGYTEKPNGDGRWIVTYVGPLRRTTSYGELRAKDTATARAIALDFATWRAAEVAEAQGYEGFRIDTRNFDVDVTRDPTYNDPFLFGDRFFGWHGGGYYPFPPYQTSPYAQLQSVASIEITLTHKPGPDDYMAASTIEQRRLAYPGAEGPPQAPPAAPPPT